MNRRQFSTLGFAGLLATLSRAQVLTDGTTLPPSSENLAKELPSTQPGPQPCGVLAELPAPPDESVNEKLFPGFQASDVKTSGATIRVFTKGEGQPLLLIHGHPETHVTWHKIAFQLAEQYTVIVPDLRGYGDSSKPGYSPDHVNYSFRAMAQDQIDVMAHFGHNRFMVAGHDRGGRVVHRLCLDHPDAVEKASVLDIAPTLTMYNDTNKEFATKYLWWFWRNLLD
jgi:haloacetate dehalogenase